MCMGILPTLYVYHVHVVPTEARGGRQLIWNWNYSQL